MALVPDQPIVVLDVADHDLARFDLRAWNEDQRAALELLMRGVDLPFDWEPGGFLAVPAARADELVPLLEDVGVGVGSAHPFQASTGRLGGWDLPRSLDWIATALVLAVVGLAVGSISAAISLAEQAPTAPGGTSLFGLQGIPIREVLEFATAWVVSGVTGVLLLGAAGAVALPRLSDAPAWRTTPRWPARAKLALVLTAIVAGASVIAAGIQIVVGIWQPGPSLSVGGSAAVSYIVGGAFAGLLPSAAALLGTIHALRRATRSEPDDPEP